MLDDDQPTGDLAPPDAPRPWRGLLDEVRSRWTLGQLAAGALLCVGVLAATVAVLRPATPRPRTELSLPSAASASTSTPARTATTSPTVLVIHVAGAVVSPGLHRLTPGSRVSDAIAAAGGLAEGADADRVNLAAPVRDGERVTVPRVGEPGAGEVDQGAADGAASGPVDLNSATIAQLDALPGVGPTTAKAIVDDRERNGPFRSVDDLLRVRGIGPAKLDQLRGMVTV